MRLTDSPRWLALALLLSLGGNAFFGGYLFGRGGGDDHAHRPPGPPGPPPRPEHFAERLLEKLGPADAALVRAFLEENRAAFDDDDRRRHAFPDRLRAALLAEPFDAAALDRVLAEHDEAEYRAHGRLREAVVRKAAALSPEARRLILSLGPPGPPPGGPGGPPRHGPPPGPPPGGPGGEPPPRR